MSKRVAAMAAGTVLAITAYLAALLGITSAVFGAGVTPAPALAAPLARTAVYEGNLSVQSVAPVNGRVIAEGVREAAGDPTPLPVLGPRPEPAPAAGPTPEPAPEATPATERDTRTGDYAGGTTSTPTSTASKTLTQLTIADLIAMIPTGSTFTDRSRQRPSTDPIGDR